MAEAIQEEREPFEERVWWQRIHQARRNVENEEVPFTKEAVREAGEWVTCACGTLDCDIPRAEYSNRPLDRNLGMYGMSFHDHVRSSNLHARNNEWRKAKDHVKYAAETLMKIEKRAMEVLRELEEGS